MEKISGIFTVHAKNKSLIDELFDALSGDIKGQFEELLKSMEAKGKTIPIDAKVFELAKQPIRQKEVQKPENHDLLNEINAMLQNIFEKSKAPVEIKENEVSRTIFVELNKSETKPTNYLTKINELQDLKTVQSLRQTLKELVTTLTKETNPVEGLVKPAASEPQSPRQTFKNIITTLTRETEALVKPATKTAPATSEPQLLVAAAQTNVSSTIKVDVSEGELGQEITKTVQEFITNRFVDSKHVEIIVNPRHLGEVRLEMVKTDGAIEVKVSVSNGEVREQVKQVLDEVKRELSDKGIDLQYNISDDKESEQQKRKEQPEVEPNTIEEESVDEASFNDLIQKQIGV